MRSAAGVEVILMRAVIMGWHRLAYLRELIKVAMRKEKQASLAWYRKGMQAVTDFKYCIVPH